MEKRFRVVGLPGGGGAESCCGLLGQGVERPTGKSAGLRLFENTECQLRLAGSQQSPRIGQPVEPFARRCIARGLKEGNAFAHASALDDDDAEIVIGERVAWFAYQDEAVKPLRVC